MQSSSDCLRSICFDWLNCSSEWIDWFDCEKATCKAQRCTCNVARCMGRLLYASCHLVYSTFGAFLAENVAPRGRFCDPTWIQNGSKIELLSLAPRLDSPKITSGRRFGQKHETNTKNRCENRFFLMAQNHVWHYTLRLFHTFAILKQNQENQCKKGCRKSSFLG